MEPSPASPKKMEPRSHGRQKCHAAVKERPFRAALQPHPFGTESRRDGRNAA